MQATARQTCHGNVFARGEGQATGSFFFFPVTLGHKECLGKPMAVYHCRFSGEQPLAVVSWGKFSAAAFVSGSDPQSSCQNDESDLGPQS